MMGEKMEKLAVQLKTKDKDFWIKTILFGAYLLVHFILCFCHEPWRDEAQAYLIVRDLSFSDMLRQLTVEGHPILWYLAMWIPVKLGLTVHYLSFVSFALSAIGTYVFIYKAPFKTWAKALILPGMIFMYSLPIIARDYCLVALLLPLIAYYYDKRYEKPVIYGILIFLLLQVHVIMAGVAIMLAGVMLLETLFDTDKRRKVSSYIPFSFGAAGTGALILQLRAGSSLLDLNADNLDDFVLDILSNIPLFIRNMLVGCLDAVQWFWENPDRTLQKVMVVLLLIGILVNIVLIKYYWRELLIALGGIGAHVFIHMYIWGYIPQRTICTMFIYLIYVWMVCGRKQMVMKEKWAEKLSVVWKLYSVCMVIVLSVLSYPLAFNSIKADVTGNYSGAEETAEFIRDELPEDAVVIAAAKDFYVTPIVAHYDESYDKIWNPMKLDYEKTFVDWNIRGHYVEGIDAVTELIKAHFNEGDNLYILDAEGGTLIYEGLERYEVVYTQQDNPGVWGETYTIYKYKWNQ